MLRSPLNINKSNKPLTSHTAAKSPKIMTYVSFFAIGYILTTSIFMMIQSKVALSAQLVTVVSILVGAYIAVLKFIKHQKRALNRSEINQLTIASIVIVWLLTLVYLLVLWFFLFDAVSREVLVEMTKQQPLPLLGALMMIVVLTLVSARLGIWIFNRMLAPK
ncbi:ABZJ_00895 family protein [Psychrobacter sp. 16-MNA-CIBAN-0192]|uniref:ABZJ_00895 family protein n=1 Tax=Psychrobacter sp. 16-MNA-CIBAN-0192 TaxID=3140448 RepID=UPI003321D4F5